MSGESYCPECSAVFTGLPHNCTKARMLLTDEEINDIDNELVEIPEWINETDEYKSFLFSRRYYAKAQLKKVVERLKNDTTN